MNKHQALLLRSLIRKAANELDDISASSFPEIFPRLKCNGELVAAGTRICWNGMFKKAMVDLFDTIEHNPDNAPTLWEDINYKNGYRVIPETITSTSAFAKGEIGWWNDIMYESLYDSNCWNPEQFAAGWKTLRHNRG